MRKWEPGAVPHEGWAGEGFASVTRVGRELRAAAADAKWDRTAARRGRPADQRRNARAVLLRRRSANAAAARGRRDLDQRRVRRSDGGARPRDPDRRSTP